MTAKGVLLDTNVLSELVRGRPNPTVISFVTHLPAPWISVLTLHELVYGAERLADPLQRERLLTWIDTIRIRFAARTLSVDADIADIAGRLRAAAERGGRRVDVVDALLGASALSRGLAVATRNVRDFEVLQVATVDPWA
jgi:toxin FitB